MAVACVIPKNSTLQCIFNWLHFCLEVKDDFGLHTIFSAVSPTVERCPVGKHANFVIRVLNVVFNARLSEHKLILEWDLHVVLQMLLKLSPFEHIKHEKLKKVFLI